MADKNAPRGAVSRDRWAAQIALEGAGFDAMTMRGVAAALETTPGSLYAHVRNKAELDDQLVGSLCARVILPAPDPALWSAQLAEVCRQLRDQYLRYPGISRAALAAAPNSLDTLRVAEGMLAILLAGGVAPRTAVWAIDAALLYVAAYGFEASLRRDPVTDTDELTSGDGHDRFDFALDLMFRGLIPGAGQGAPARSNTRERSDS